MGGLRGLGLVEEGFGVSEVGLGVYRFWEVCHFAMHFSLALDLFRDHWRLDAFWL